MDAQFRCYVPFFVPWRWRAPCCDCLIWFQPTKDSEATHHWLACMWFGQQFFCVSAHVFFSSKEASNIKRLNWYGWLVGVCFFLRLFSWIQSTLQTVSHHSLFKALGWVFFWNSAGLGVAFTLWLVESRPQSEAWRWTWFLESIFRVTKNINSGKEHVFGFSNYNAILTLFIFLLFVICSRLCRALHPREFACIGWHPFPCWAEKARGTLTACNSVTCSDHAVAAVLLWSGNCAVWGVKSVGLHHFALWSQWSWLFLQLVDFPCFVVPLPMNLEWPDGKTWSTSGSSFAWKMAWPYIDSSAAGACAVGCLSTFAFEKSLKPTRGVQKFDLPSMERAKYFSTSVSSVGYRYQ